jgi:4-carboxymuconolactone decarboxylase
MAKQDQLDQPTLHLVRFAAAVALADPAELREQAVRLRTEQVPAAWVEEVLLQSVLMVGYPRALIAFGLWRRASPTRAPATDSEADYARVAEWTRRGEEACALIYGENYRKLRENIRELHPALDAWMITEGYGRVLSRPALDLLRRELCIVAQMAVLDADRQLHSHLRGALNAGALPEQVEAALSVVNPLLPFDQWRRVKELWRKVREGE